MGTWALPETYTQQPEGAVPSCPRYNYNITYGVAALQSSSNRTVDLYSEYRGNKLQALKNGCNLHLKARFKKLIVNDRFDVT